MNFIKNNIFSVTIEKIPDGDDIKIKNHEYNLRLNNVFACEINKSKISNKYLKKYTNLKIENHIKKGISAKKELLKNLKINSKQNIKIIDKPKSGKRFYIEILDKDNKIGFNEKFNNLLRKNNLEGGNKNGTFKI
jgi:hypothetical protein